MLFDKMKMLMNQELREKLNISLNKRPLIITYRDMNFNILSSILKLMTKSRNEWLQSYRCFIQIKKPEIYFSGFLFVNPS